jgi:hypothetical protein
MRQNIRNAAYKSDMGNWNAEQNSMRREMKIRNAAHAQLFL